MREHFFTSLTAFAAFIERAKAFELVADQAARAATAQLYAREMRDRIGDASRLPPPLADSTTIQRLEKGYTADDTLYASGVLHDSIGSGDVSIRKTVAGSTDEKAVWHELGPTNGHFPARSFIASTAAEQHDAAFETYVKMFGVTFHPR